jgi:hypothetical protein
VNNETSNQSTSPGSQQNLSHVNIHFLPQMVDVSQKNVTSRKARAQAIVELPADVVRFFSGGDIQTKASVFDLLYKVSTTFSLFCLIIERSCVCNSHSCRNIGCKTNSSSHSILSSNSSGKLQN